MGHRLQRYATLKERQTKPYVLRDIPASAKEVALQIERLGTHPHVKVQLISETGALYPIYRVDLPAQGTGGSRGRSSRRLKIDPRARGPIRVLLSGWIHGDEPVGAYTAPAFIRWALKQKNYRKRFDTTLFIKIDPFGTRDTPGGDNLNRCFQPGVWTSETRAIRRSLGTAHYDLFLDLHGSGGGAPGAWLIRGHDDGKMSRRILGAMPSKALWDVPPQKASVFSETCDCDFTFHALGAVTSNSTGTFKWYMSQRNTPYSYTLEVPRDLSPRQQVQTNLKMLRSAIYNVEKYGKRKIYDTPR